MPDEPAGDPGTSTPPSPPPSSPASAAPDTGEGDTDWEAEAKKWKDLARKHEERSKANLTAAKELEQLRQSAMTEQEKAVAAAKAEGRTEALRTIGARLVDAEVKAAVAGRNVNVEALLDGLDRSRFLDDEGEPNTRAINAWVEKLAPPVDPTRTAWPPDLGQGARGAPPSGADMNSMLRRAAGRS